MNFGWLRPSSDDDEVKRVVLHEFGHALGLVHEHQSPAVQIQWDRDAVIRDCSKYWTEEEIELNIFEPYDRRETNYSNFDPQSIMIYPIPASWTRNGVAYPLDRTLSATDREFIRRQYPW
jgi:hypothetical protein